LRRIVSLLAVFIFLTSAGFVLGEEGRTLRCWNCGRSFSVPSGETEGICPSCGKRCLLRAAVPRPAPLPLPAAAGPAETQTYDFSGRWKAVETLPTLAAEDEIALSLFRTGTEKRLGSFRLVETRAEGKVEKTGEFETLGFILYLYLPSGEILAKGSLEGEDLVLLFFAPAPWPMSVRMRR